MPSGHCSLAFDAAGRSSVLPSNTLLVDRKPDEPAKRQQEAPAVRPATAPSGSNQEAAEAEARSKALRRDRGNGRFPRKAPKTSRRARPAPHWSAAASFAADGSPGCAPRRRRKRTTPARPILAPNRSLAENRLRRRRQITPQRQTPEPLRATSSAGLLGRIGLDYALEFQGPRVSSHFVAAHTAA